MKPAPETQNVAPRAQRTPAETVEISLPIAKEIRETADLLGIPERRVREMVVDFAAPIIERKIAGQVAGIVRAYVTKLLPMPFQAIEPADHPISFSAETEARLRAQMEGSR